MWFYLWLMCCLFLKIEDSPNAFSFWLLISFLCGWEHILNGLNPLKHTEICLWPGISCNLENVTYAFEKYIYLSFLGRVFYKCLSAKLVDSVGQVFYIRAPFVFSCSTSDWKWGVEPFITEQPVIVELFFSFNSIHFGFRYFEALLLHTVTLTAVTSS